MCLKIDTLVFVGLDIAVESASGSILITCTGDYSMRRRLCSRVKEPVDHCMLDHLLWSSTLICIVRALLAI